MHFYSNSSIDCRLIVDGFWIKYIVSDWIYCIDRLVDWLIEWLIDWLIDWFIVWFIDHDSFKSDIDRLLSLVFI